MVKGRVVDAVIFGAAAALGSSIVALIFRGLDRKIDAHHLSVNQVQMEMLPELVRVACIHPNSCSLTVV